MVLDNTLQGYYGRVMKAFLNASEVSRMLSVDRATVGRWIKKGVIKGVKRPEHTQQWRIPFSSVESILNHKNS